jgi:hypothetical protein
MVSRVRRDEWLPLFLSQPWGERQPHHKGGEKLMQLHIQTDKERVIVLAEVAKIEVEDILSPEPGDELYFRRVRFVTRFGEAIEVLCDAYNQHQLRLHRGKKLKPVKQPNLDNWLSPEVYTGTVDEEQESD